MTLETNPQPDPMNMTATHTTPATHTTGLSSAHKLNYAVGKIGLIPAFGDFIGKDVTKAELFLARCYVQSAAESHADLLAALESITALAYELTMKASTLTPAVDRVIPQARAALARAKGETP